MKGLEEFLHLLVYGGVIIFATIGIVVVMIIFMSIACQIYYLLKEHLHDKIVIRQLKKEHAKKLKKREKELEKEFDNR